MSSKTTDSETSEDTKSEVKPVKAKAAKPAAAPVPAPVAAPIPEPEPVKQQKLKIRNNLMQVIHLSLRDASGRMRSLEILAKAIVPWDDVDLGPEAIRLEARRHITVIRNA